jgi:restriction system protein
MARRGFFAEINHQIKVAAREQKRAASQAEREYQAAVREGERARKAEERAAKRLARANQAERKRFEKEAREAHIAAMEAEVERRNSELATIYDEIDTILRATLDVDDYVDLESLKIVVEHPPFDREDLETPVPSPEPILDPPEPILTTPAPPKGISGLLFRKRYEVAVAEAEAAHDEAVAGWRDELVQLQARREEAAAEHARLEAQRLATLETERARYTAECSAREEDAAERNKAVDDLIANVGYGVAEAVEEYVGIVLSNSIYPPHFEVKHEFEFDAPSAELRLRVAVPNPDVVPTVKAYKYAKSADEINTTQLPQKTCKDRYAGALHQVALRSLHEVFEADRRGLIKTVSAEVGTEAKDPATGRQAFFSFVAVGAERNAFLEFDLSSVVPAATLAHLGAAVSKNPFDLIPADTSGVRST